MLLYYFVYIRMNKLLLIITVFVISSCSENSFDSCVSEVEKLMYESWEKNHIRYIEVDNKKYCNGKGLTLSRLNSSIVSCNSEYSFSNLPPTTNEEKEILKNALKDSRDNAVIRCSNSSK